MKYPGKTILFVAALGVGSASAQNQPSTAQQPATTDRPAASATDNRVVQGVKNILTEWQLHELPPAVQKTVREQAGNLKIEDIDREDRTGQTIWEVEFERDGQNIEIHVADNGRLLPEDRAGARVATSPSDTPSTTPGIGTPATRESGRKAGPGMKWEELPKAVQDKAMAWGQKENVADIDLEERNGQTAYEIEFRREGRNLELLFSEAGNLLESNDPNAKPTAQGAPAPGTSGTTPRPQPQPPVDNPEKPRN